MIRGLLVIPAGILLTIGLASLAGIVSGKWTGWMPMALMIAAFGGVLLLQRGDRRVEDARRAQARAHADDRERELSALARSPDFSLGIKGASALWLSLPMFLFGCALLAFSVLTASMAYGLIGTLVLAAGALLLAGDLPVLGKPILSITARGLESPLVPFLPWSAIEGIHLRANPSRLRDEPECHTLLVRVPSLPDRIARFGLFHRILFRLKRKARRERFHIVLRRTSEPPVVIYRLMRQLWFRGTGWEFDWDPDMSDAYNAAMRNLGMPREDTRTLGVGKAGDMSIAEASKVVVAELARRRRMLGRLSLAVSVLFLLYLLSVLGRLFN